MRVRGCDPAVQRRDSPDPGVLCEAPGLSLPARPEQDDRTRVVELRRVGRDGVAVAAGEDGRRRGACRARDPVAVEDENRDPGARSQRGALAPAGLTGSWPAGRRRPVDQATTLPAPSARTPAASASVRRGRAVERVACSTDRHGSPCGRRPSRRSRIAAAAVFVTFEEPTARGSRRRRSSCARRWPAKGGTSSPRASRAARSSAGRARARPQRPGDGGVGRSGALCRVARRARGR